MVEREGPDEELQLAQQLKHDDVFKIMTILKDTFTTYGNFKHRNH